jgi:uncharacterized repeat protein (TIGR01451 family)
MPLPPELSLTKEDEGGDVEPGDTISYLLTYNNAGGDATGVVITETVPANTTFNSAASTSGWVCEDGNAGSSCTFNLGEVANSDSGSVNFAATVDDPLPADVTEISNTAEIGDDGSGGVDSEPDNNTASVYTTIKPPPAPDDYIYYLPVIFK